MQLSNTEYAEVVNKPEIIGFDFSTLIGPGVDLATNLIGNWGSKPPPPPPPPQVPWVPIAIGGGFMMMMVMMMSMQKPKRR